MATDKIEVLSNLQHKSSRKRYKRLRPMIEHLTEYTENTTIHGIKYLGWKKRPFAEKIYWIIIFTICLILLGFFIRQITLKWGHKFVILVEDETLTPIHKLPFPAVTICPQYKVKKTEFSYRQFNKLRNKRNTSEYNEYEMKYQLTQQLCSFKTVVLVAEKFNISTGFLNKSHIELLHKISPTFGDILNCEMVNKCNTKLSGLKLTSSSFPFTADTFSTILTNEGVCFTLNFDPNIIRNDKVQTDYPYYTTSSNNTGLCSATEISRIILNLNTDKSNLDTLCQPTQLGYKVILHSPEMYPTTFENYIAINHESKTRIKVQPKIITTSETLRSYTPKQRQCYFIGERQLKYFRYYNRVNCKLECFANYTFVMFGCVHFAFPRSPGVPICSGMINYSELYEMVDGLDSLLTYLQDNPDKRKAEEFQNYSKLLPLTCDCLSECNSIDYEYTTNVENFNFETIFQEVVNFLEYENMTKVEDPAEFEIFWENPKFKGTIRKQLYTFSDLVSHFGGLLGLFMGASILSIFEIIYFCVIRHFTKNYCKR